MTEADARASARKVPEMARRTSRPVTFRRRQGRVAPCGARAPRRAAARAASLGRLTRRARRPPRDAVVPVCPPPLRRLPGQRARPGGQGRQRDRSFERHLSAPFVAVRAHQERSSRYCLRRASSTLSCAMSAMVSLLAGESATARSSLPHLRKSTRPRFSWACRSPTRSFDYVVRIAIHSACVPVWTPTRRGNLRAELGLSRWLVATDAACRDFRASSVRNMTRLLSATNELTTWADVASASHGEVEKHFRSHRATEQEELPPADGHGPAVCVVAGWFRRHDEYDKG